MINSNIQTEANVNGYLPKTNVYTLVSGEYKGFCLPLGKYYRENNIAKANSILALALVEQKNFFTFEIHEEALHQHFGNHLKLFDSQALYLKVGLVNHVRLGIFTTKTQEEVIEFLEKRYDDFSIRESIHSVDLNALQTAQEAYSFAENFLHPKKERKGKQMTGCDLTPDEKLVFVEFELKPTIRYS